MFKVLHIDQSKFFRTAVKEIMDEIGVVSISVPSQGKALEVLFETEVDLIITGLELADSKGEDLIVEINRTKFKEIPIIVLTSKDSMELREKVFNLGVLDYILKNEISKEKMERYFNSFRKRAPELLRMNDLNIAVLDDSILCLKIIRSTLELNQMKNVDYYTNPHDLLNSEKDYAIYFLDLVLPDISGEQVVLEIRKRNIRSIIILVSAITNYKTVSNILLSGADDYIMKPFDANVFMARLKTQMRTYMLMEDLEEKNRALAQMAITDGLTELYNHKHIIERLNEEVYRAQRYEKSLSILLFDIDNFKAVNDTYGHQVGDDVIHQVANVIKNNVRISDIVGRYGGEEFMVLLTESSKEQAMEVGEKIRLSIERFVYQETDLKITISCGGSEYSGNTGKEMIKEADERLYKAKREGKNRVIM